MDRPKHALDLAARKNDELGAMSDCDGGLTAKYIGKPNRDLGLAEHKNGELKAWLTKAKAALVAPTPGGRRLGPHNHGHPGARQQPGGSPFQLEGGGAPHNQHGHLAAPTPGGRRLGPNRHGHPGARQQPEEGPSQFGIYTDAELASNHGLSDDIYGPDRG